MEWKFSFTIIRNDANCHNFFVLLEGRQETEDLHLPVRQAEEALTLIFSETYDAFIVFTGRKADIHIHFFLRKLTIEDRFEAVGYY